MDKDEVVEAHLPNPGRLWELFFPGVLLYLQEHAPSLQRKTRYTVIAVERDNRPVMLHTGATNKVARNLLESDRIPTLTGARILKEEYTHGRNRFDFLIEHQGKERLLEIKSCTLFGNRVAMFPDAITERGRRHLLELAQISIDTRTKPIVMFVISWPDIDWFMPDYHTDLEFSRTLMEVSSAVEVIPVAVGWNKDLALQDKVNVVPVPWDFLRQEVDDRGSYLLILTLGKGISVDVGSLGRLRFDAGQYVYIGSAMNHLSKRIARHKRRIGSSKKSHWHIDYLREVADEVQALPVVSSKRLECDLTKAMTAISRPIHPGFGCSDCHCGSHLFRLDKNPLHLPEFHQLVQRFRMRPPEVRTGNR